MSSKNCSPGLTAYPGTSRHPERGTSHQALAAEKQCQGLHTAICLRLNLTTRAGRMPCWLFPAENTTSSRQSGQQRLTTDHYTALSRNIPHILFNPAETEKSQTPHENCRKPRAIFSYLHFVILEHQLAVG